MKKNHYIMIIISALLILIIAVSLFKKEKVASIIELNAKVNYEEKCFTITNIDSIDFVHADLILDQYYKIRNINLRVGETYTIWQMEFLHHNGTHFPLKRKPGTFSIWSEIYDGKRGYFSRKIK